MLCLRTSLLAAALVASGCAAAAPGPEQQQAAAILAKPNVVIILADDLGYADISTYGIKRINTPNIDRIAKSGVAFTDGYSAAPVCSPSHWRPRLASRHAVRELRKRFSCAGMCSTRNTGFARRR